MSVSGNLPVNENVNDTTEYFNNYFSQEYAASPNVNSAVIGYFQSICGNKEAGKILGTAVIYTALTRGIDPMSLVDEFKKMSDRSRLANLDQPGGNTNANVHVAITPGVAYADRVVITSNIVQQSGNVTTTSAITVNLLGTEDRLLTTGYVYEGYIPGGTSVQGNLSLVGANKANDSFIAQSTTAEYGSFTLTSAGAWQYTVDYANISQRDTLTETITVQRSSKSANTQSITFTIDNGAGFGVVSAIEVKILDEILPSQITAKLSTSANVVILPQSNTIGVNKFGKFTVDLTGLWYYIPNQFLILDKNAKRGPIFAENNLNEINAYLTVLLNTNRVNTSLLGISNTPEVNKYILRAIKP